MRTDWTLLGLIYVLLIVLLYQTTLLHTDERFWLSDFYQVYNLFPETSSLFISSVTKVHELGIYQGINTEDLGTRH